MLIKYIEGKANQNEDMPNSYVMWKKVIYMGCGKSPFKISQKLATIHVKFQMIFSS